VRVDAAGGKNSKNKEKHRFNSHAIRRVKETVPRAGVGSRGGLYNATVAQHGQPPIPTAQRRLRNRAATKSQLRCRSSRTPREIVMQIVSILKISGSGGRQKSLGPAIAASPCVQSDRRAGDFFRHLRLALAPAQRCPCSTSGQIQPLTLASKPTIGLAKNFWPARAPASLKRAPQAPRLSVFHTLECSGFSYSVEDSTR
jgi:hypothetical protein